MLRGQIAGIAVQIDGCDDLSFAPRFAAFSAFSGDAAFAMRVRTAPLTVPDDSTLLHQRGEMRILRLADGDRAVLMGATKQTAAMLLRFDEGFSRVELTLDADAAASQTQRYLQVTRCFSYFLASRGGCLLHSAAVAEDGVCIALLAPSGGGKSTLARRWTEIRPHAHILNEETPALLPQANGFRLYGTPFCGTDTAFENAAASLRALVVLTKAEEDRVVRLSVREALFEVLSCQPRPPYSEATGTAAADAALALVQRIPAFRLYGRGTTDTARLLRESLCLPKGSDRI